MAVVNLRKFLLFRFEFKTLPRISVCDNKKSHGDSHMKRMLVVLLMGINQGVRSHLGMFVTKCHYFSLS